MAANYEAIMREQNIVTAEQRCCFMLGVSAAEKAAEALKPSHNNARDAIATIIFDACREFDENGTVNANDYADQVLRYVATAPVA
jgi:hypothetical protein